MYVLLRVQALKKKNLHNILRIAETVPPQGKMLFSIFDVQPKNMKL